MTTSHTTGLGAAEAAWDAEEVAQQGGETHSGPSRDLQATDPSAPPSSSVHELAPEDVARLRLDDSSPASPQFSEPNTSVAAVAGSDVPFLSQEDHTSEEDQQGSETTESPTVHRMITGNEILQPEQVPKVSKLKEPDPRPHMNVVFIGHVDSGKSTTCGKILVEAGKVDARTVEKYEREAKEQNRESWVYAFIVDINEEERAKGKTVEVSRATFELEKMRFTILDTPGHKGFVPNMISGAAQADVGVLIISARRGEFETGFDRGGQSREHALLAKTLGVNHLVVAVNKMDDPTCEWSKDRFDEVERKLTPFLKSCGFAPGKDLTFVPISGLMGHNLSTHVSDPVFGPKTNKNSSWYDKSKPTLFRLLDSLPPMDRDPNYPLRIPLLEGYRDQGTTVCGKIEAGTLVQGVTAVLMPKNIRVKVSTVLIGGDSVPYAKPGENVTIRITGADEDQISKGDVLCSVEKPCPVVTRFLAQMMVVELLEHKPIITAGYSCVMHLHTSCEEVQVTRITETFDKATKKKKLNPPFARHNSLTVCEFEIMQPTCMEPFASVGQLGRFSLRDEGKTIAVGKVLAVLG